MSTLDELVNEIRKPPGAGADALAASYAAMQKLLRSKEPGVAEALRTLSRESIAYGYGAVEALEKRAKKADAAAFDALADVARHGGSESPVQSRAVDALARLKDPHAIAVVVELARPEHPARVTATRALEERVHRDKGARSDERIVDAFLRVIDDPDCRYSAVHGLKAAASPKAVGALVRFLDDENVDVRLGVYDALASIGDPAALGPLRERRERAPENERTWNLDRAIQKLEGGR